jgi:hypothetical protein
VATVTRATTAWGVDQGGNVAAFAAGQPVVNTAGLAAYEARTNYVVNPTFQGTGGTKGGSNIAGIVGNVPDRMQIRNDAPGVTVTIVGTGTEFGLPYMDLDLAGTCPATTWFRLFWETATIPGATGQTWTYTFFARLLSGSTSGLGSVPLYADVFNSGSSYVGTQNFGSVLSQFVASAAPVRISGQAAIAAAGAAILSPYLAISTGSAAPVAARIRFYAPNFKLGQDINDPPILQTNNAAATRNADVVVETVNIPVGQPFTVTGKLIAPVTNTGQFPTVFELRDAANQNNLTVHFDGGTNNFYCVATSGGSVANYAGGAFDATRAPGTVVGFAVTVDATGIKWSVNGGADKMLPALANGPFQAALTQLGISCRVAGTQQLNAPLRDLAITMRAFTSAERQAASDVTLTHDLDFVSQVYQYVGAPYVTPTDLPMTTFSRASAATGLAGGGQVVSFAAGALRITDVGCYFDPPATNRLLHSQDMGQAAWSRISGASVSLVDGAPDGTASMAKVTGGGLTSSRIQQVLSPVSAATVYSISVHVAYDTAASSRVAIFDGAVGTQLAAVAINWTNGVPSLGTINGTFAVAPALTQLGTSGIWRITCGVDTGAFTSLATLLYPDYTAGTGATKFWGAQLEVGAYASPYIQTGAFAASRSADVLATANDNSPAAYTVLAEFSIPVTGPDFGRVWNWGDGTTNNRARLYYDRTSSKLIVSVVNAGVQVAFLDLGVVAPGSSLKVAAAFAASDFAAVRSGGSVVTGSSGAPPATSVFSVGSAEAGGAQFGGPIKRIRRWSVRKTNSELQALAA